MEIYLDTEYRCHTANPEGEFRVVVLSEKAEDFFNGKCPEFIEGFRYVPEGECYTQEDGKSSHGECIVAWKPYSELDAAQREYERQKFLELETNQIELNTSYTQGVNSI